MSAADRYKVDIDAVVTGLKARGRHEEARLWREGADAHLAGRTGCHNWATVKRLLAEFERE